MTTLERLKLELSHKEYFTDADYTTFIEENTLTATESYDKATMQRSLLYTCIDVLEALSNDTDMMRKIDNPDIINIDACIKFIKIRIEDIKKRIATIPVPQDEYANSNVSLLYSRNRR